MEETHDILFFAMSSNQRKVVVITGASSGIGASLAREYARQGYAVGMLARRKDRLVALAKEIESNGGRCLPCEADVTQEKSLRAAFENIRISLGPINTVIANAGYCAQGRFENLSLEEFRKQFDINFFGAISTIQTGLGDLKATKGKLALIGSVSGYFSMPGVSAYSASKAAIKGLSESLTKELAGHGISVTHVVPGHVESEIDFVDNWGQRTELRRATSARFGAMPADVAAKQIYRAVESRKRTCVITRQAKFGLWLNRYFPLVFDRLLALKAR